MIAHRGRFGLLTAFILLSISDEVLSDGPRWDQCPNRPPGRLGEDRTLTCPLPGLLGIIPEAQSASTSWSFPPQCVLPKETADNTRLDCLFTSTDFRNSHGISLVTSTTVASHLVGLGAFYDLPGPLAAQRRDARGPMYEIVDIPGKGKGVIAKRRIRRGEIFMVDFPAVLVSTSFLMDTKPHHRRRILKQAISQLPNTTQSEMYALSRLPGTHEVDTIFGTNTNTVVIGDSDVHVGLFVKAARINHSCRPNAYYRFSERRLTLEMVAYVAIEPGEEILISYSDLTMKREERRKYLQDNWGFECNCPLCHAPEDEISGSEGRRRQMESLGKTLLDARKNGFFKDAITIAGDMLNFAEWEELPILAPEYYDILADLYFLEGDIPSSTRYARMALNSWVNWGSVDDEQLENARRFLRGLSLIADKRGNR